MRPPAGRVGVSSDEQEDMLPRVVGQRAHVRGVGKRGAGLAAVVVPGDARIAPRNGEKKKKSEPHTETVASCGGWVCSEGTCIHKTQPASDAVTPFTVAVDNER